MCVCLRISLTHYLPLSVNHYACVYTHARQTGRDMTVDKVQEVQCLFELNLLASYCDLPEKPVHVEIDNY